MDGFYEGQGGRRQNEMVKKLTFLLEMGIELLESMHYIKYLKLCSI